MGGCPFHRYLSLLREYVNSSALGLTAGCNLGVDLKMEGGGVEG